MRTMILITVLTALLVSCEETDVVQYEYISSTMMGRTVVTITQDSVVTTFNGRGEPTRNARKTEASEWSALFKSLAEGDLNKMPTVESPTNGRATDRSPYGTLIITTKDSAYTSASFDGKNPHEMLMPLMNEVVKIWEK